ncbi:MAG TPA: RHS repeat-associated core domain-containing protein, partial [Chitinophagales bacterium]|nr:RHS repeat-associated core domain-containing protein [Chitinophagales bacterium]
EDNYFYRSLGEKRYELSNHLGNVLSVISDRRLAFDTDANGTTNYYESDVMSAQDYDPFGMLLVGRSWSVSYRYGFNGKEMDAETYGQGNIYDYGFRIYNPRLGKFLSVDPLAATYPWYSTYHFASNNPIFFIDIDGLEGGSSQPGSTVNTGTYLVLDEQGEQVPLNLAVVEIRPAPENNKPNWLKVLNIHNVLDVLGAIDPTGVIDVAHGLIYLAKKDYVNASISFISAAPGGDVVKTLRLADDSKVIAKIIKTADVASTGKKAADDLPKFEREMVELADELEVKFGKTKTAVDGTKKHTEFGKRVKEMGYEDVQVEQPYLGGRKIESSVGGSSRPDITIVDDAGTPTNVYDYKTGNAKVRESQRRKNESNTGVKHTGTLRATH